MGGFHHIPDFAQAPRCRLLDRVPVLRRVSCAVDSFKEDRSDTVSFVFSDNSGSIDFDEFKNVFSANIGPDAFPFNFDW